MQSRKIDRFAINSGKVSHVKQCHSTLNPNAVGMARGHFTANKIQNVPNVKFRSRALVFNSKFDQKLFSSLKIT